MARPLSEAIAEMQSLEDVGTPESMAQAAELRAKIEGAGYGDQPKSPPFWITGVDPLPKPVVR